MHKYSLFKMFSHDWICEKCKKGIVEYTGWEKTDAELARYEHKCPKCGKIVMCIKKYPVLEYPWDVPDSTLKKFKINKKYLIKKYL